MEQTFSTTLNTLSSTAGTSSTAADGYVSAGVAFVTGLPSMVWKGIKSLILKRALVETANVVVISGTKANSTRFGFTIMQNQNGAQPKYTNVGYTSDATATATEIKNALVAIMVANNVSGQCSVTAVGAVNSNDFTVTLTAAAGEPLFQVQNLVNVTQASGMATFTGEDAAGSTANVIGNPVIVTFTAAHGLVSGSKVSFTTGWTGAGSGVLLNGVTSRVTYISTTSVSVDEVLATTTNKAIAGAAVKVAQEEYGQPTQVEAVISTGTVASTYQYDSATFVMENGNVNQLWIKANLIASPYTINTNLATMRTTLTNLQTAKASGTAIPELALQTV